MAVLVSQEFESTTDEYDQVAAKIDPENNPPDGMIVHSAEDMGGGKMRAVDVWESPDKFQKFAEERLGPAVAEVVGDDSPEPKIEIRELHNVVKV
jgi:hypothetical protein